MLPGAKPAEDGLGGPAVKSKMAPIHKLELAGLMLTVGLALTVTLAVAVAVQPFALVAVTVKLYPPLVGLLNVARLVVLVNVPPELLQL